MDVEKADDSELEWNGLDGVTVGDGIAVLP
jgi:hypothetical protein